MEKKYTPMMQQYLEVKKNYQDALVFYRLGDFYEMFFDDARIASTELDLVLTGRNAGVEEKVPMCGIPFHAYKNYAMRLVQRGYKVVIVEQMEDPAAAKGIVKRDVVKVITPGTIMDENGDDKNSIYIASIVDYQYGYGMVMVEMSTGETVVINLNHQTSSLLQTLLKNNIKEIVVNNGFNEKVIKDIRELDNIVISYCDVEDIQEAYLPLCDKIQDQRLRCAYGRLLNYLEETQKRMLSHLQVVSIESEDAIMAMDYNTLCNLELISQNKSKKESLWSFLDKCQSAMGSRLLKQWIEKPLLLQADIEKRLDRVAYLHKNFLIRDDLREKLANIYDIQRLIARIAMNNANAIDCLRLEKTLKEIPEIFKLLDNDIFKSLIAVDDCQELYQMLAGIINEEAPVQVRDGNIFNPGYNAQLDELRKIQSDNQDWIVELEAKEKERTGIKTLKVGYNRVFGYYIEVSKGALAQVKDEYGYIRKQTLTNGERFITSELKAKEDMILHAKENALKLEIELFNELLKKIRNYLVKLQKLAHVLATIDCIYALSEIASEYGYVRPTFDEDILEIVDGKHPILDKMMKKKYVANSIHMDKSNYVHIITGPNMGGKSTYMRQIALIVIMAQMGSFVPCKKCTMPIFDKIFTRIGASDDILGGKSTFMVEMVEANNALSYASDRSLILFDEIGRGTSTYDGMAIAQAMIEYIVTNIHAKTLFSTHYHELTAVSDILEGVSNKHVEVHEAKEGITFLYKVKDGKANRSYGINVAKLAHLPANLIKRGEEILKDLENNKKEIQQSIPIFSIEDNKNEEIITLLKEVDVNELTPMNALNMINDLKHKIK
ncbi:MAG: DNA mismatch repair protein MutS [Erysipelotrichaceae bacterium]|nr:DNA mismatch repair protein MutS [Erysipelotrichaceae bacterium]MDY5252977.1 DNA mismatch repair protein MutS [Erysipelotrichaceae bacterium]